MPEIAALFRCRWRNIHEWVDTDGDDQPDTCAVCGKRSWPACEPRANAFGFPRR